MFGLGDLHAAMVDGGKGVYGCEVRGDVEDALGELTRLEEWGFLLHCSTMPVAICYG